jgi:hypothetical protein
MIKGPLVPITVDTVEVGAENDLRQAQMGQKGR